MDERRMPPSSLEMSLCGSRIDRSHSHRLLLAAFLGSRAGQTARRPPPSYQEVSPCLPWDDQFHLSCATSAKFLRDRDGRTQAAWEQAPCDIAGMVYGMTETGASASVSWALVPVLQCHYVTLCGIHTALRARLVILRDINSLLGGILQPAAHEIVHRWPSEGMRPTAHTPLGTTQNEPC